ncbi:acetylcholine receptor subunit beta-type acr-2 isoform X5 [Lingula anatina]|uniref:Acetylcholine receptor subunit beta-type acr-2 isoform X5 n=1 Tax=Lingula anatina TaxID=7574 RepID=A0A1S3J8T1_LINAN|nr:acetylcholine receptor subunit beta-type acr-2 isoform X5 [Lingula anatina]|eukprot:XP_013406817.1 acetylcholine receptor subunit beta-type acr-2 isoform X5 [Lingula anatina]
MTRSCIGLYFVYVILTSIRIQCFVSRTGLGSEDESKLVEDLFDKTGYNPLIRPVQNLSDKLMINFGLTMIQLINVDEKNQIMKTNVWLQTVWYDYQLVWDPADYGGISSIRVPMDKVWTPDIVLFNNADGKFSEDYKSNVIIYSNISDTSGGSNYLLRAPPAIYKSSCQLDVKYFPFDEQICDMYFGSWTYNSEEFGFDWYISYYADGSVFWNYSNTDLMDYMPSGIWGIVDGEGKIIEIEKGNTKTTRVIYTLKIRRKTLFYIVNLIIPCMLIATLSVFNFYLPAEAGEKITLTISVLVSLVFFIILVSKLLPPNSEAVPLIAEFLFFTFLMNIISVFNTVILINWHYRSPKAHRMNRWVRVVFLNYLPKLLMIRRPNHDALYIRGLKRRKKYQKMINLAFFGNSDLSPKWADGVLQVHDGSCPQCMGHIKSISSDVIGSAERVAFIADHLQNVDETAMVLQDWKYIAHVIDRLLFFIFMIVTAGGATGIFFDGPHILADRGPTKA